MISNPNSTVVSTDTASASTLSGKVLTTTTTPNTTTNNTDLKASSSSSNTNDNNNETSDLELDEYSQKATRTLYIGNLDRDVKHSDIREKLDKKYGDIVEIEIKKDSKKQPSSISSYAFIQFSDVKSVIRAIRSMHGKTIGKSEVKLGFGKSKPTRTLWLDNVSDQLKENQLYDYFKPYCENDVEQILIDRNKCQALVYFEYINDAKECADKIRARKFYDKRIVVDFASKEFISSRFEHLLDSKSNFIPPSNHNRVSNAYSSAYTNSIIPSSSTTQDPSSNANNKEKSTSQYSKRRSRSSPRSVNGTGRSSRSCSIESDVDKKRRPHAGKNKSSNERKSKSSTTDQSKIPANSKDGKNKYEEEAASNNQSSSSTSSISSSSSHESCNAAVQSSKADRHDSERSSRKKTTTSTTTTSEKSRAAPSRNESSRNLSPNDLCHLLTDLYPTNVSSSRSAASSNTKSSSHGLNYEAYPNYSSSPAPVASTGGLNGRSSAHQHYNSNVTGGGANFYYHDNGGRSYKFDEIDVEGGSNNSRRSASYSKQHRGKELPVDSYSSSRRSYYKQEPHYYPTTNYPISTSSSLASSSSKLHRHNNKEVSKSTTSTSPSSRKSRYDSATKSKNSKTTNTKSTTGYDEKYLQNINRKKSHSYGSPRPKSKGDNYGVIGENKHQERKSSHHQQHHHQNSHHHNQHHNSKKETTTSSSRIKPKSDERNMGRTKGQNLSSKSSISSEQSMLNTTTSSSSSNSSAASSRSVTPSSGSYSDSTSSDDDDGDKTLPPPTAPLKRGREANSSNKKRSSLKKSSSSHHHHHHGVKKSSSTRSSSASSLNRSENSFSNSSINSELSSADSSVSISSNTSLSSSFSTSRSSNENKTPNKPTKSQGKVHKKKRSKSNNVSAELIKDNAELADSSKNTSMLEHETGGEHSSSEITNTILESVKNKSIKIEPERIQSGASTPSAPSTPNLNPNSSSFLADRITSSSTAALSSHTTPTNNTASLARKVSSSSIQHKPAVTTHIIPLLKAENETLSDPRTRDDSRKEIDLEIPEFAYHITSTSSTTIAVKPTLVDDKKLEPVSKPIAIAKKEEADEKRRASHSDIENCMEEEPSSNDLVMSSAESKMSLDERIKLLDEMLNKQKSKSQTQSSVDQPLVTSIKPISSTPVCISQSSLRNSKLFDLDEQRLSNSLHLKVNSASMEHETKPLGSGGLETDIYSMSTLAYVTSAYDRLKQHSVPLPCPLAQLVPATAITPSSPMVLSTPTTPVNPFQSSVLTPQQQNKSTPLIATTTTSTITPISAKPACLTYLRQTSLQMNNENDIIQSPTSTSVQIAEKLGLKIKPIPCGLTNTNNSVCSSPPVLDTVVAAHVLQETSTNLAVQETNESHVNEQRTSVVKSEPKEVKEPLVSTPEEPMSIASTVESQKAQNLPELPVKVVNEVKPKIVETSDSNKESTATTPTSTTIDQTKSSAKEPIKIQQNKPQQDKPSVTQTAAKKVEVEEKKTDIKTASQNPQTPTIKKPSQLPVLINKPKAQTPTSTPTTNTPVKTTSSEIKSSTTTKVVSNEHAQSETTKSTTTVTSSTKKPTTASKTSDLKDLYDSEAADSTEKTSNKAPDTKKQTVVEAKKTCDNKPVVEKHNEKQVQNEKHTEKVQKPVVKTEKTEVKEDTKTPIKSQLSTTSTTSTTKTEKPKPKVVQKPENKAKEVSVSSSTKPTIKTEASQQKKAPIRKASSSESSDSDSSSSGSSSSSRSSSSGSSSSGSSSSRSSSSSSSYSSSSSASGSPNNKTSKGETAKKTASSTIKAEKSSQVEKKKKSKEVSKKKTGKTSEKEKEKGGKVSSSSKKSSSENTSKSNKRMGKLNRELISLIDSQRFIAENYSTSMYDRVKARPRGDLPEENEKKGKRKKRSTKGKKKKKAAAKSDSSDSETSSSDDESSSNLSTSGDSSSSSSKSGSSSSSDESSSSSDEDISKKSNKQKPKKKLELDSDDEEIDSKAEEVKTKTSTKKEVKETAKKTNKSVSETPSSNKKPAKTEKRKRRKSNESLFDAEESPPNSDIDASKTTKTKSKEAKNESTPSSNQTKRSRKDSIASSSSSSTSFKAATTATKPAATAAANSTKTSDAVKKRKLSDTDENGIPSKHSKDHEDTSDESKAAPKQKKEAEHGSKNQSQPTKPAAVKSKDAKDSDNDHKSNNNIGKEKQKTSTTTTTTAASKETSKTVQKEKEKDKQKETTATTKQSQSQEKAVESTENSKQMKKPKQINKVNKETYNDQSSTKSTLSSGSNSSISGALDDEPLTLSHIIKTESKNIQNLRNNKKNSTSTTTQDEENEVDQAVKKIFDATNKNASKVESRAEVVEKKLKEEPPVEEETPSSIASSQEAVMEKSSSLEQTQPLVVESKPNEQPAVEESKKVEIEPQTNENDKVEESSQIENEAVKEVDRLAEFDIAKPLIESNCSMEIDQEKEKELDALANLADLVSTEKRDMRKERSSGSTSSNSSHRSDLLRIEPTILMLEEKEPNLMTLDVLNKPVDKLVELPAAKNQTADEKESPIVSEQRPAKSPSPPILPFKVAVVETTNPAPIEISFNPAVMDLKESIPTLLPPLNQTHTDIEPVVLEEVKQPESSHQSTEIQSMDIQQSIVATENKSNLEKDVVVVEKEEKVIESVEQKKQVQEPETTPIEAVAQVEKPPNFGNMEMLLEAMLAEKATTTSAANPVVEDTHKLQPFKVHETNTYLNEEEKSTFDSSKQQHQIEPHIIPAEIINLEAQLLEMNKKQAESNTATIPSAIPVATTPVVSKKEDNIRHIDIYQTALETLSQLQQIEQPKEVVIEKPAKQQPQQQEANPARKEKTIINPEKLDIPGLKPPIALNDQVTKLILDQLGYPSAPFGKTDVPMSFPQFNPPIAKTDEYMQLMNQATAAVAKKSSEKVKKTESPPLNQQQPQQATTKPTTSQAPQQPFSQPIINSIEAATNWQEAYSKFPLTFLTPPQFQATPQTPTVASSPIPQPKPVQQLPQTPQQQQQQQQQQMQRQSSKSSRQTPQPQQQPPVPQSPQPQVPPIVQEPKKVKTSSGSSQQQPQKQPTAAIPDASYQFLESTFMRPDIFNQMNLIFQTSQMKPERAATPPQAPQPPQAQSQAVSQHHHMHHGHHVNEAAVAAAKKQPVYEPAQVQVQTQPQPAPQEPPKQSTNIIKPPGKKQLAKEYEQKQQQLYQEQQAATNQQQQSQQHFNTSSLSNPFSQYQHHMSMPQPQYQAYYSALSELTGSSFPLFGASGTHNLPADLAHNAAAAAAAFSQQPLIGAHGLNNLMSQKQPSATPNNPNPIDYANQMLMSGFGYSDKQQQEYFNSLAFNQYTKNYLSSQMAAGTPHPQSTQGNQQQQQQQQQQQFEQQKSSLIAAQNFPASRDTFMSEQNYYNELQEHLNRILWTGSFSIKNETASVAMNFVAGNIDIAKSCLAQMTVDANNTPLKILHRMILEKNQLEGVHRKLQSDNEHSILIAVPYGRTPYEQMAETSCLRTGFINYLTEKRAAGIINVFIQNGGSYVVHIFPPCDFTMNILRYRAPDLAKQLEDYTHLFIVIATA